MKIWVVTIGEPIPHEQNSLRLHRTGILNDYLKNEIDIELTWWTSTFNHFEKKHIIDCDSEIIINNNYTIKLLKGTGYRKNVSIMRILDHYILARKLKQNFSEATDKPDLILCSFPTLGLSNVSINYGKEWNIPVVIDYRDMWPEVYVEIFPKRLQPLIELFLKPLFKKTHQIVREANSLVSITDKLLSTIKVKANRIEENLDISIPLAYSNEVEESELQERIKYFESIFNENFEIRICFFGNLGRSFDFQFLNTLLTDIKYNTVEIIICGTGQQEEEIKSLSKKYKNLKYLGYVGALEVKAIMSLSDYGLCPYINNEAFLSSIPGKVYEYLSEGLDIIHTLKNGELGKYLSSKDIGYFYDVNDPNSFFKIIDQLINKPPESKRKRIQQIFEADFSSKTINKIYFNHLKKIRDEFQGNREKKI